MRKLVVTAVATIFLTGSFVWQAQAQTQQGLVGIHSAAKNYTPVEKAACQGWGPFCGPGYVRACGPYRCWCRPCR
jgi:hypothetical protein